MKLWSSQKILPASGSFWSNLNLSRMTILAGWFWGWKVRVNWIMSLLSACDICSADGRSFCWRDDVPPWSHRQARTAASFCETGRRLGDRFRENLRDVEKDDKDAFRPVERHFNLPHHSKQHRAICSPSLLQGSTERCKNPPNRHP